jgi:hypothetical protein
MVGKSPVKASDEQRTALENLAVSRDRGARAVLLTLNGWTSARIAEADLEKIANGLRCAGGRAGKLHMEGALDPQNELGAPRLSMPRSRSRRLDGKTSMIFARCG